VGKSTIVGNLRGVCRHGAQRAVLDADPQHSLVPGRRKATDAGAHVQKVADGAARCVASKQGRERRRYRADRHAAGHAGGGLPGGAAADLLLLPCGPSPLDLFALKEALSWGLKARAERRSKKPRIRFVPSKVVMTTNLGGVGVLAEGHGRKVLPGIGQRVVVAERWHTD